MTKIQTHIGSRIWWLVFGAGLGVFQIAEGVQMSAIGLTISGLGLLSLGVSWFLRPIPLGRPIGSVLTSMADAALGSNALHTALTFTGMGCLVLGLVLRYALGV